MAKWKRSWNGEGCFTESLTPPTCDDANKLLLGCKIGNIYRASISPKKQIGSNRKNKPESIETGKMFRQQVVASSTADGSTTQRMIPVGYAELQRASRTWADWAATDERRLHVPTKTKKAVWERPLRSDSQLIPIKEKFSFFYIL